MAAHPTWSAWARTMRQPVVGFSTSLVALGGLVVALAWLMRAGVVPSYAPTPSAFAWWGVLALGGMLYVAVGLAHLLLLPPDVGQDVHVGAFLYRSPAPALGFAACGVAALVSRALTPFLTFADAAPAVAHAFEEAVQGVELFVGLASATLFIVGFGLVARAWSARRGSRAAKGGATTWLMVAAALAVATLLALPFV